VKSQSDLRVKIFADGADKASFLELYRRTYIKGFTTNPTHMRAMGITDYQGFALDLLATIQDRPISFEVFADDEVEMEEQARHISAWGKNVFVKIPVMNTEGEPTYELVFRSMSPRCSLWNKCGRSVECCKETLPRTFRFLLDVLPIPAVTPCL
jgi:transaldolase